MSSLYNQLFNLSYHCSRITPGKRWLVLGLLAGVSLGAPMLQSLKAPTKGITVTTPSLPFAAAVALPALTVPELQQAVQALETPSLTVRGQHYQLTVKGRLNALVSLLKALADSSHSPSRYQLSLVEQSKPTPHYLTQPVEFSVTLQPGQFTAADDAPFSSLVSWLESVETSTAEPLVAKENCQPPPPPTLIITATWPQRGYAMVVHQGVTRRIQLNQVLESSWQLKRMSTDWLEFHWNSSNPGCQQMHRAAVAI